MQSLQSESAEKCTIIGLSNLEQTDKAEKTNMQSQSKDQKKGRKEKTNFSRVLVHGFINEKCQTMTGNIFSNYSAITNEKKVLHNFYNPTEH